MPSLAKEFGLSVSGVSLVLPQELRGRQVSNKPTPPEVVAIVEELGAQGLLLREISDRTGYSLSQVSKILNREKESRAQMTEGEKIEALVMFGHGQPLEDLAARYGRSLSTMNTLVRESRPPQVSRPRSPRTVGIKRDRLKERILDLWSQGLPIAQIATDLDCADNTVRRCLDAARPGERIARTTAHRPPERACVGCGVVMREEEFAVRIDRSGKYHSRCRPCFLLWSRGYQNAHPERNREGVRRRRARLRKARTEAYRDEQVYQRDKSLCWFCGETVDTTLRYPDGRSPVIHHLHPISKNGPDILKNIALAHYDCNHRAKDSYECPLTSYVVMPISAAQARPLIIEHHYLHRATPSSYYFGLVDPDDAIVGVVAFGTPPSHRIVTSITDDRSLKVLSLNRLWIADSAPFGAGSYFVSRALKDLPAAIIVAYSDTDVFDPRYATAHHGGIYRACSFRFAGYSKPNTEWRMPDQGHNVGMSTEGAVRSSVSPKARYWTVTGDKKQKRQLGRAVKWLSLPYAALDSPA